MKHRYGVHIRGNQHLWIFHVDAPPEHVADWRADGLEVDELYNSIPFWAQQAGLTLLWCFVQDIFHFRNPFR